MGLHSGEIAYAMIKSPWPAGEAALPDGGVGGPPAKAGGATDSFATTKTVVDGGHNEP